MPKEQIFRLLNKILFYFKKYIYDHILMHSFQHVQSLALIQNLSLKNLFK